MIPYALFLFRSLLRRLALPWPCIRGHHWGLLWKKSDHLGSGVQGVVMSMLFPTILVTSKNGWKWYLTCGSTISVPTWCMKQAYQKLITKTISNLCEGRYSVRSAFLCIILFINLIMYGSFTVYPRPRSGRNLPAFKVKSVLRGTEVDREWSVKVSCTGSKFHPVSRQELVGWLQH